MVYYCSMSENAIYLLLLVIITLDFVLERVLSLLNARSAKKEIPRELEGIYDEAQYRKSQEYQRTSSRFGHLSAVFSFVLILAAIYFGWFGELDAWVRTFSPFEPVTTLIFFGILFVVSDVLSTPFSLYHTFIIEQHFGFNTMTLKTYWLDKLKSYLLTLVIGGLLLAVLVYLVMRMGSNFWIYFWVVTSLFVLFINVFYTALILPLFNKLKPVEDGALKASIEAYSEKVRFPLKNIFVMDGSKRSSKGNAFFSGLGRRKKVVLFDTLIEKHTVEELTAVFAHEWVITKRNTLSSVLY